MSHNRNFSSLIICPECSRQLRLIEGDKIQTYCCPIGHTYTMPLLLAAQDHALDRVLGTAVRMLAEHERLLNELTLDEYKAGRENLALHYEGQSVEAKKHADSIRHYLLNKSSLIQEISPPLL